MLNVSNIQIQRLHSALWKNISCDVLRLDEIHPVVSGNKWFKLQYYLQEARASGKTTIATFGGAYSNHIVATAFACKEAGLQSIGFIRGEASSSVSASLQEASSLEMQLQFVSREAYQNKNSIKSQYANEPWFWINEGGYGKTGMLGAADILSTTGTSSYTHIICCCGTGTTLAGLINAALPHQTCIGVSALKGYVNLERDVMELLPEGHPTTGFEVWHDYHFGGYAKHPKELIDWMNELWRKEQLPTDIVYTSKLLFAVRDLIDKNYFTNQHKLLIIHSGGLQGNRSLAAGTLEFL